MADSINLAVFKVWAAMAWADGKIAPDEARALRRLVENAPLTQDERETALSFLEQQVTLSASDYSNLSVDARQGIYRAACRLAKVDNEVSDTERNLLTQLRSVLSVADTAAGEIELEVLGG